MQRLIWFPHAGGGREVLAAWRPYVPPSLELHVATLPGRLLSREAPLTQLERAVDHHLATLASLLDGDTVLVGHSIGALVATAVAERLATRG